MNRRDEIKRAADNFEAMVEETIMAYGLSEQRARIILTDQLRRQQNNFDEQYKYPLSKKVHNVD